MTVPHTITPAGLTAEGTAFLVRTARGHAGLTQRQLASMAEVDPSYVSLIESGDRAPQLVVLGRLLDACGYELEVCAVHRGGM